MVIFHYGDVAKDKGEKVRGGVIHSGISHGKKELHHQENVLDKKLRVEVSMKEKKERRRGTRN